MTLYARVFLAFLKGLMSADDKTDAYIFHTRLIRVTSALRDNDNLRAAGRLSLMAEGFGGGTDIAGSLSAFCDSYAEAALNGRTVAIILSDGYCTGEPEALGDGGRADSETRCVGGGVGPGGGERGGVSR